MTGGRLARAAGILSLGSGSAVVVQLLLGVVLARVWSREAYGSFLQVTMLVATLSPILFLGLPSSLYYFLARETGAARDHFLAQTVLLLVGLGAAGGLLLAAGAPVLAGALNNDALATAIRRYGLALVGMLPAAVAHPLLVSEKRHRAATFFVAGVAVADATVTVGAVLAGWPLERLVLGLAAMHCAAGAGVVAAVVRRSGPAAFLRLDRARLREQLRYAVPFAASMHVGTLGRFLDRYIIGAVYMPALFAVYAVGAKEVPVVPLVLSSVTIVLQQRFTELSREGRSAEILPSWQAAMRTQALLVLPLAVVLLLVADPFVTGLYSERYRDSVPVFRVYLALLVLRIAAWPMVLVATGETAVLLRGALLSLATSAAVSLALIQPFGLLGPAVGAVAGPLVAALYALKRTERVLGLSWRRIVPWRALGGVAGCAVVAALPFAAVVRGPVGPLAGLGVAAGYATLFLGLAMATGAIARDDVRTVRGWLGIEDAPARRWGRGARRDATGRGRG